MAELFGSAAVFQRRVDFRELPAAAGGVFAVHQPGVCGGGGHLALPAKTWDVLVWFRAARFARPAFFFADWCGTLEPEFEEAEAEYETEGSL